MMNKYFNAVFTIIEPMRNFPSNKMFCSKPVIVIEVGIEDVRILMLGSTDYLKSY